MSALVEKAWVWYYTKLSVEWGLSDRSVFVFSTWMVYFVVVWTLQALLYLCYHFELFQQYKIRGARYPSRSLVIAAVSNALVSRTLFSPLALYYLIYPWVASSVDFSLRVPSLWTLAWQGVVMFLLLDFFFYWQHRLAHHRLLYKHMHKKHHRFKNTIGVAFDYAHPLEDLLINTLPLFISLWIVKMHCAHWILFLGIRLWETIEAHSGYEFPWSPWHLLGGGSGPHDFHHSHNVGSYGILHIWDPLLGTDRAYNEWRAKTGGREPPAKPKTQKKKE